MFTISDNEQLRGWFWILRTTECSTVLKHGIRDSIAHYYADKLDITVVNHSDSWLAVTNKIVFPAYIKTYDAALQYFIDNHYCERVNTMLDCSNRPSTAWYKLFQRADLRWCVYHCLSFDV